MLLLGLTTGRHARQLVLELPLSRWCADDGSTAHMQAAMHMGAGGRQLVR
jgi:hypothetical protein